MGGAALGREIRNWIADITKLQISVRNASPYPVDLRGEFGWRVSKATRLGELLQGVNVHGKSTQRRRRGEEKPQGSQRGKVRSGRLRITLPFYLNSRHPSAVVSFSCN